MNETDNNTKSSDYAAYFLKKHRRWWRLILPVQVPYKWFARRICRGNVLEIGCGAGRYLNFLFPRATGVDHNPEMISYVKEAGFTAYLSQEFLTIWPGGKLFDTLLCSHTLEHMNFSAGCQLMQEYLRFLLPEGRVVIIVPQGAAFFTDPTHVCKYDDKLIEKLSAATGLRLLKAYSFPMPNFLSKIFPYNDAVYILKKLNSASTKDNENIRS